ncbi:hypothetical protein BCR35DRAFT_289575 [Leucosporidium creatinivorum]|uniref:2,4-dienoyl-CoA reductase [(3E)-enoyl-CoA-producing] n=1 Tax=Leucosporidium creatinivorum TaxID=106004 RepID=A0A1Y2FXU2_9BASI|nr:hypothetical protein BCR35DRAFT_289575 [Leucosporidium creatinivorum]
MSSFKPDIFAGKVAFVTGGGSGICYGMTQALLAHGANATILGRREANIRDAAAKLTKDTGKECLGIAGDVRKPESLKAAIEATVKRFGRIDFVICGAAGNFLSPISGLSENAFKTVLEIDTMGTYNTIKATIGEVKKAKGAYIAISATLHYRGSVLQAHVSAAKAGIDALMNVVAVEYGPAGVRANVIAPGPIEGTEGVARLIPKDVIAETTKAIPSQRYGTIEDIGNAGVFLFSPAASYVNGAVLVVDGAQWHNSTTSKSVPYPDMFLEEGDTRSKIASRL